MGRFIDLTKQKFGKLTVIKQLPDHYTSGGNKVHKWLCKCDCGIDDNIILDKESLDNVVEGNKVVASVLDKIDNHNYNGKIIRVLGHINDPGIDICFSNLQFFPQHLLRGRNADITRSPGRSFDRSGVAVVVLV